MIITAFLVEPYLDIRMGINRPGSPSTAENSAYQPFSRPYRGMPSALAIPENGPHLQPPDPTSYDI
ncbi:hypothetical protein BU26DRAFT_523010 [Trematosphaeria pertusa]|uniref:Uncharacterized protein n=1 Tax=Trematosphaeria pertusa TaxID=390896 RepID=A0A6A6I2G6_9PLEO|nr:uncharacterized protein BU26DRAFT_523010 [Trematosphaeria pertusa]KAF2244349.1 hypothetical protein BU26DRAFT_523010 [Trematosphaeria pertusa]